MTRAIRALLNRAASEYVELGVVPTDTQMALAAEGYELSRLERDLARAAG